MRPQGNLSDALRKAFSWGQNLPNFLCPVHLTSHDKIRNQKYSQWQGHEELVECESRTDPDFQVRDQCALACEGAEKLRRERARAIPLSLRNRHHVTA
jgi:hypothetical protein